MTFGEAFTGIVTGSPHVHILETIENHDNDMESYEKTKELLKRHPEINTLYFAAAGVYGGCQAVN